MMNSRFLKSYKIILIFILKVEVICIYAHSKILKIDFRGQKAGDNAIAFIDEIEKIKENVVKESNI